MEIKDTTHYRTNIDFPLWKTPSL